MGFSLDIGMGCCQALLNQVQSCAVTDADDAVPLRNVIGENARRLRGDATADDVAKAARRYGLNWGTGRISDLEHGRVSPTLPTLAALVLALGDVRDAKVTLGDLLDCDQNISVTTALTISSDQLRRFLASGDMFGFALASPRDWIAELRDQWPARLHEVSAGALMRLLGDFGEPEERLARDLGLDRERLAAEMAALWRRSYHAERDRRAGVDANAQKKGRVARELKAELRTVLDGDD
ncbi:helix-turn-helix domain-containing protein [Mycolicibacterium wolinskyi]|uniref:helix-turn-helix domain-containing protein n=1 Tax=Mycolicibacterium wolinskyi TaxID=59750 RepID=UPI00391779EF